MYNSKDATLKNIGESAVFVRDNLRTLFPNKISYISIEIYQMNSDWNISGLMHTQWALDYRINRCKPCESLSNSTQWYIFLTPSIIDVMFFLSSVMHNTTLGSWIEWYSYFSEIHRGDKKLNFNDDTWIERKAVHLRAWSMLSVCDKLWSSKSKRYQIECHESSSGARLHLQRCNPYIFILNILLNLKIRELAQSHIAEWYLAVELRYWICPCSYPIIYPEIHV